MVSNELDVNNYIKMPDDWQLTDKHQIPILKGLHFKQLPEDFYLVPFNEAYKVNKSIRKHCNIHFFLADYLFERTWSKLTQTADFLKDYKTVLSPDFSLYTDMPIAMQIFNHYKKMYVSKYWQDRGMRVIPVACWSDERSFDFCFEGMPKNSLVAVSSVGVMNNKNAQLLFSQGYSKMLEVLEPKQILWYGKEHECMDNSIPHIIVQPSYIERFKK